jgi:hypothetical protein
MGLSEWKWLKSLSSAVLYYFLSRRAMMHLVIVISIFIVPNWLLVNNKLVRMWKEVAIALFKVLSCHLSEWLRKPTINLSQDSWHPSRDKIRHLPNTRHTTHAGCFCVVPWVMSYHHQNCSYCSSCYLQIMCIVLNCCRFCASGSWSQYCLLHHINFVTTPISLFHFMISRIWHLC